jgi:ribosomal protein S18 acetylase RimI-like enzyme
MAIDSSRAFSGVAAQQMVFVGFGKRSLGGHINYNPDGETLRMGTSSALAVRQYESADAEQVWELHEEALRDANSYHDEYIDRDTDLRRVETAYLDAGGAFLVGTLADELVAMGAYRPVSAEFPLATLDAVEIKRMRVDPAHQRQGHGQTILDALEARASDSDYDEAVLDTTEQQDGAQAFYEQNGYEQIKRADAGPATILYYRKEL